MAVWAVRGGVVSGSGCAGRWRHTFFHLSLSLGIHCWALTYFFRGVFVLAYFRSMYRLLYRSMYRSMDRLLYRLSYLLV